MSGLLVAAAAWPPVVLLVGLLLGRLLRSEDRLEEAQRTAAWETASPRLRTGPPAGDVGGRVPAHLAVRAS